MRKLNIFFVIGMFVSFLAHGIMGALKICGADTDALKWVAWVCAGFIAAHMVVTLILTVQTLQIRKRTGAGYFKQNHMFWARRISGLVIPIPLIMHLLIFQATTAQGGAYRLQVFTIGKMLSQILLVLAIALHVMTNIRPLLITFGVKETKESAVDLLLILSAVLLFFAAAFAIYYLRWMAV